jgi:hypothetical protein
MNTSLDSIQEFTNGDTLYLFKERGGFQAAVYTAPGYDIFLTYGVYLSYWSGKRTHSKAQFNTRAEAEAYARMIIVNARFDSHGEVTTSPV